jgi:3-hydroxyacyl-CoA dehydrogenase/enoyl-CoA hydratase/carnithine racemase
MMLSSFRLEIADGIALLTFDMPGSKANTLGQAMLAELESALADIEGRNDLVGLLLQSGKPGMFIAGADLKELGDSRITVESARAIVERGLSVVARFERLPFPTVALIDGPCVGGGLELALGFDDRIAGSHPRAELGLPETKIGLIPGWGGTQRLSRLIGPHLAGDMIASGDSVSATRAREIGLVFDAVASERLLDEGKRRLATLRENEAYHAIRRTKQHPVGLTADQVTFGFAALRTQVLAKTKGHFPAPLAALDAIERGCNRPLAEGLAVETEVFVPLVGSVISRNLIALFFQNQRLAKDPGVADSKLTAHVVKRVGVVGAGLMGAGIAGAHLRRGVPVSLLDVSAEAVQRGVDTIAKAMHGRVEAGRMTAAEMTQSMSLLAPAHDQAGLAGCDVVIEAIVERENAKTALYRGIAPQLGMETILASNTSTISISRMAESAPDPTKFAGLHFFNPVERMQLVEVIRGSQTSDQTVVTLVALVKRLGKSAIVVNDCPGFLVNRILFPYLNEAMALLQEGADPRAIDAAATAFGMPMGPIALSDVVGLDTCLFAGQVIDAAYAERAVKHTILADLVVAGRLGQKSGAGFYSYAKGPRGLDDPDLAPFLARHRTGQTKLTPEELTDRLLLPMVGEASRVVMEKIVRDPIDVDMGLILGIGFPTFRGGLLRWAETVGWPEICGRMERLAPLGARFEPTAWIRERAAT